jgi:GNAT superfamily N-acetyltransferase
VRIIDGGAAVAMWDPPKGHFGTPAPPDLPPDVLRRIALYDEAIDDVFPSTPYWYLGVLAAHPDRAGQGLGRAVMAEGVQRAAAERVPAYLETTNERNVDLYERAGWEVVAVIPVEELDIRVMRNASGVARP